MDESLAKIWQTLLLKNKNNIEKLKKYDIIKLNNGVVAFLWRKEFIAMENKPTILVVEDEDGIRNYLSAVLATNNYNVLKTSKGREAITMAASYCPDLILLDLGLPDLYGMEVLRSIRQWTNLPVIIVSSHDYEDEKVTALDFGADDYVTKPFGISELLARIRTELRHSQKIDSLSPIRNIGDIKIDLSKRTVSISQREIHLTPNEYKIIVLLSQHVGRVLTHDFIIREIWGPYTNETYASELQALRVNVANIRRKIEINPAEPKYIITEVSVGYRMTEAW